MQIDEANNRETSGQKINFLFFPHRTVQNTYTVRKPLANHRIEPSCWNELN